MYNVSALLLFLSSFVSNVENLFFVGILVKMRSTADGGRDKKVRKIRRHSPSGEEASDGGGVPLKKGPWTAAEDAILVDYVTKHGEGNWNAVQKHSGLARCGKSCRLRWANHLRPDLKKGAFSPEEERLIIELHAKMGNKWARMAAEVLKMLFFLNFSC